MKYTLIRDGDVKTLMAGTKKVGTWDKHDSYDYCLEQAQSRLGEEDTLVEKDKSNEPDTQESPEAA